MMTHRFVVPGQRLIAVVLLLSLVCLPLQAADVKEVKLDKAQQEAVDKLRAKGAAVMQIAADTDALAVNLGILGKQATDEDLAQVAKLPKVQQLDLHNTAVTDAGLSAIADLTTLTHLHLNGTAVTDAGLAHLKKLTALEYLNLYNTAVTDAGLKHLEGLKSLQKLYLWQTKVTDAGAKSLKSAVPAVVINRGEELALPPPPPPEDPKTAAKPDDKKPDAKKPAAGKGPDIDEEGFLRTWLVLGPFPIQGAAGEEIDASQLPNEGKLSPKAGEKVKINDKDLAWKSTKADDYFLDFNELFDASGQDNVGVYAVAFVNAAKEVKDVTLLMGSNDQGKVYLNGKELAKFTSGRSLEKDSEEAKGLTLNKGMNTVVLKVINESNNWQGCVRLVDKAGKPVQGLTLATPGDEKEPAAAKPAENKPAEKKPAEKKPAEKKPAEKKPAAKPAGDKQTSAPGEAVAQPAAAVVKAQPAVDAPAADKPAAKPEAGNLVKPTADPAHWRLEQHEEAKATMAAADGAIVFNVTSDDGTDWHVQAFQTPIDFKNNTEYVVTFKAKADEERPAKVQAGIDEEDYHGIGLDEEITLGKDWKDYSYKFTASDTVAMKNRIGFVMGQAKGKVYVKDLVVKASK